MSGNTIKTDVLPVGAASIERAASLLRAGEVVAFPTETVYGLGADALNPAAVRGIFAAKRRPADNPLIAHIADLDALDALVSAIDDRALRLAASFWPGPLTLVLPKASCVPDEVTAGLGTVAVRMPSHPAALALIRAAGRPIAAPSANRSGKPSPTSAAHVLEDMDGCIPLILDGGPCAVGVESTVLDISTDRPVVLRPGGITVEQLRELLPDAEVHATALMPLADGAAARSPGMRHRHYAPAAEVMIVRGAPDAAAEKARTLYDEATACGVRAAILCAAAHVDRYPGRDARALGENAAQMAAGFFDALRAMDAAGVGRIVIEAVGTDGIGLALMNRMLRAADFTVFDV